MTVVYYESMKRKLKIKPIYESCDNVIRNKKKKLSWLFGILPLGFSAPVRGRRGRWGGWSPDSVTGAGERVVLVHYAGTRRVAFGVENAWSLFPHDGRRA
jgi:hypothetical protein